MKFTAKEIVSVDNLRFGRDGTGKVNAIQVECQVNFERAPGKTMGMNLSTDIWPHLNAAQREKASSFYSGLVSIVNRQLITDELEVD